MTIEPLDVGSKKTLLLFCSLLHSQRQERPGTPLSHPGGRQPMISDTSLSALTTALASCIQELQGEQPTDGTQTRNRAIIRCSPQASLLLKHLCLL